MKLLLNSPFWYIGLCILLAGLGAYFLYRRDKNLEELKLGWKRFLAVLRFVSLFILAFLLLEPLLEYAKQKVEKPIIAIIQDDSQSILNGQDSASFVADYSSKIERLQTELSEKYEVVSYSFGNELTENKEVSFGQNSTNLSQVFTEIENRYYNRNLGGIVLVSDGIYNKGSNPIYKAERLNKVPVYSIAMGDTAPRKDVRIDKVLHNKLAYKGNSFPVVVEVGNEQFSGKSTEVQLIKSGKVIGSKVITFSNSISTLQFETEASEIGLQKYTVVVKNLGGEVTYQNNIQSFYVDVLETKQQILLVANSPHPDIKAIKSAIENNENYELTVMLAADFKESPDKYGMIITHNLPSAIHDGKAIFDSKTPTLSFIGNQTDFNQLNKLKLGVTISGVKSFTEASGYYNPNFSSFTVSNKLPTQLVSLRPLQVPFSTSYKVGNSVDVGLYQRIGPAKTEYPILGFGTRNETKNGFFVGEGIWGWRLQEFAVNGNADIIDELLQQSVQLLVAKEDKSRFKVSGKSSYELSENVSFSAEVYNKSYELVTTNEVKMTLKNEEGKEFSYQFSPKGNSYLLDAGKLKPGQYSYLASTVLDGVTKTKSGEFSINSLGLEQKNLQANHQLLFSLSDVTGGEMVTLNETGQLIERIKANENLVNVIYEEKEIDDLVDLKPIFFLLLLLLGLEWFVRKRNGGY